MLLQLQVAKASTDELQREESPIDRKIPDDLQSHDPRIAHERILVLVDRDERLVGIKINAVVFARPRGDGFAIQIAQDEIGDVRVTDADEIAAGRVKRIGKHTGFAGEPQRSPEKTRAQP